MTVDGLRVFLQQGDRRYWHIWQNMEQWSSHHQHSDLPSYPSLKFSVAFKIFNTSLVLILQIVLSRLYQLLVNLHFINHNKIVNSDEFLWIIFDHPLSKKNKLLNSKYKISRYFKINEWLYYILDRYCQMN